MDPLMFLLKLAWESRYRLPLLITIGFMILDIRMQLEINIQTRTVRRPVPINVDLAQQQQGTNEDRHAELASALDGDSSWGSLELTTDDDDDTVDNSSDEGSEKSSSSSLESSTTTSELEGLMTPIFSVI